VDLGRGIATKGREDGFPNICVCTVDLIDAVMAPQES
jgi:hypothetical protein